MRSDKTMLRETLEMLYKDLNEEEQSITRLKLTLVERENNRLKIIDAIYDVEEMLKDGKVS